MSTFFPENKNNLVEIFYDQLQILQLLTKICLVKTFVFIVTSIKLSQSEASQPLAAFQEKQKGIIVSIIAT